MTAQMGQTKDVHILFYSLRNNKTAKQWRIMLPFDKYVHVGLQVDNMIFNLPTGRNNPRLLWLSQDLSHKIWGKPDESFYLGKTNVDWKTIFDFCLNTKTNLFNQYIYVLSLRLIKTENCVTIVGDYINLFFNTKLNVNLPGHLYKEAKKWNYTIYQ